MWSLLCPLFSCAAVSSPTHAPTHPSPHPAPHSPRDLHSVDRRLQPRTTDRTTGRHVRMQKRCAQGVVVVRRHRRRRDTAERKEEKTRRQSSTQLDRERRARCSETSAGTGMSKEWRRVRVHARGRVCVCVRRRCTYNTTKIERKVGNGKRGCSNNRTHNAKLHTP